MKKIVALAFLLPLISSAQDSATAKCKLIREKDPYTKETRLSTGFIKLDGGSVTIDADSKEIDVLFTIDGADKCFDNSSIAAVFLEGVKTKMSSRNGGTMNCEGLFHFIFKNTATVPTLLQKIMTQRIDHILFTGNNKKESTITIKEEDRDKLMALATCLVNEAKKLIQ